MASFVTNQKSRGQTKREYYWNSGSKIYPICAGKTSGRKKLRAHEHRRVWVIIEYEIHYRLQTPDSWELRACTDVGRSSVHRAVVLYICRVRVVWTKLVAVERLRLETSRRKRGSHVYACSRWNYRSKFARRIKQQILLREQCRFVLCCDILRERGVIRAPSSYWILLG